MKIKNRTTLTMGASILFIVVLTLVIVYFIFSKFLNNNELKGINTSFETINYIISKEEDSLKSTGTDWAHWNETYNFIEGIDSEYIDRNFQDNTFATLKLNLIICTDSQGNVVFNKEYELNNESLNATTNEIINRSPDNFKKLITFQDVNEKHSGILFLNGKLFIIAALPVTTSDEKAASNGALIMGRCVNENFLNYMMNVSHNNISFEENVLFEKNNELTLNKEFSKITASRNLNNIFGNKTITSFITIERDEFNNAIYAFKVFIFIFLLLIIFISSLDIFIINKYIIKRIRILHEFMEYVAMKKDTGVRVTLNGDDELFDLAKSTNRMLSELEAAYNEITYLSFNDKLTGLKNRVYIEKIFEEINNKKVSNYAIIMGDLNGLKITNDTFGHKEGDKLLIIISKILKDNCEVDDIVSRWGGDEFIILIQNKDSSYVSQLINKIKASCCDGRELKFKFNIALGSAETKDSFIKTEELMKIAEERMYRNKLMESKSFRSASITSLEKSLHEKHNETEEHTTRIRNLCVQFGFKLGLSQEELDELELLGALHDIGKIGISNQILMKPEKLTDDEWGIMKTHTEIGYRIAKASPGLEHIADEILYHHERFDGTGYPHGLKGYDIPFLSRILNIVDSFDVMTHSRSYKNALSVEFAIKELKRCSGSQFDPELVQVFLDLILGEEVAID